jgi:hypothetical protein
MNFVSIRMLVWISFALFAHCKFAWVHGQPLQTLPAESMNNEKTDGYRGIWFELNQKYEYGDKYSGGLGTYTAKHIPLAVYAEVVNKTFFVYGGTTTQYDRHLLCMIGEFDHTTGKVSKPTVVHDKMGVDDPHDNPSLMLDDRGYIWVFVSGRGRARSGYKYRSIEPYKIDAFEQVTEEEFTYPQIWLTDDGYFHFFTKYTGIRELYFETFSKAGGWSKDIKIAGIREQPNEHGGHYQVSNCYRRQLLGTFFNRHPNGDVDRRTDLYYVQTVDFGKTWTDIQGHQLRLPLLDVDNAARVMDYQAQGKNVYMKDMGFDQDGHPVCLYITSNGHEPGPANAPYEWKVTRWTGKQWETHVVANSDHNYDMGSLYIKDSTWQVVGPTEDGPQKYGVGGELAIWTSRDQGAHWSRDKLITQNSRLNHAYVRRPVNAKAPFCFFWADGDPHAFSKSQLYFGDFNGNVWKLPYHMDTTQEAPIRVSFKR